MCVCVDRGEFKTLFDSQVDLMLVLIDQQFARIQESHTATHVVESL